MKQKNIDLLHGRILPSLLGLAMPIMATSMVQTAYNLTDMAWIGQVGSNAVTAVGAAGMYTWLSGGIVTVARMGGQIKVAHSLGSGEIEDAAAYARGALQMTLLLALVYALFTNVFPKQLIGFFGLENGETAREAEIYLCITCGLILFSFLNQTLTGLFTAVGDGRTPFLANGIGLAVNMVLDPVLIFGLGPAPQLGVAGAAIATVTAQIIVTLVLIYGAAKEMVLLHRVHVLKLTGGNFFHTIIRLGLPSSMQNMLYCGISMVLTKMVAGWGDAAVAVQRIGGQVECISWMTAEGFGAAMNAFVGQNYGAKLYERVKKSYSTAIILILAWGLLTSFLLIFGAEPIFRIFIREPEVVPIGVEYLIIIGYSQLFMCEELMIVGTLQGLGKTMSCSMITIILTGLRIPMAYVLSATSLGVNGIWWALSISSILKGIIFVGYSVWVMRKL